MQKHKWYNEIVAWASGAEIEFKDPLQGWSECKNLSWTENAIYRIKPQPKEPQYLYVYNRNNWIGLSVVKPSAKDEIYVGKIKLENEDG